MKRVGKKAWCKSQPNPIKRRSCKHDSSVAWYNLGKAKPMKEHICIEVGDYIKKAYSHQDFHPMQEQDKELQSSVAFAKRKKLKLITGLKTHIDQQSLNVDLRKQETENKTGEYLSVLEGDKETSLVDVNLTVKANHRAENVPFVCLTSKFMNGKAVLGYPLQIGELSSDDSECGELLDGQGSRFRQLVWRTSRRTPVCYVTKSLSPSVSKNVPVLPGGENGAIVKEKSPMKNRKQGDAAAGRACVSVQLVFSKLLAAVAQPQS